MVALSGCMGVPFRFLRATGCYVAEFVSLQAVTCYMLWFWVGMRRESRGWIDRFMYAHVDAL